MMRPLQSTEGHIMSNEQKVVIVTGASQGIGADLVRAYRDRNYRVIASSRSIKPGADADVLAVPGDISRAGTAERIVARRLRRFGRIDSLVNNAGVFLSKPFIEFTQDDYAHNMAVNVAGFFHITQRAAAEMLKQGSGHIVSITTSLVDQPIAGVPAALASMTKGALERGHQSAGHRVREQRRSRQRRRPRDHQDADAPGRDPRRTRGPAPGRPDGRDPRHRRGRSLSSRPRPS